MSALVHSSTLVTAGVYLLIRLFPTIKKFPSSLTYLIIISSLTILIARIAALIENDLKKIIALSTLRQLGVIIISLSIKLDQCTFFHLITHAIFKALMFLCAGTLIIINSHTQDLRASSNVITQAPITTSAMLISASALAGFPFLAGFYSKDIILEIALQNQLPWLPLITLILATVLTSTYTIRLLIVILQRPMPPFPLNSANTAKINLSIPTLSLALIRIFSGSLIN